MKQTIIIIICAMFAYIASAQPRVSIFCDHIDVIAEQENIPFRQAAEKIKAAGCNGIDVWVTIDEEKQRILDELGFAHVSAMIHIGYGKNNMEKQEKQALDFMKKYRYQTLMLVFDLNPSKEDWAAMEKRLRHFTRTVRKAGFQVAVEDYDDLGSPTYNTAALDRIFAVSPHMKHVFDTGNYLFAGEDVLLSLHHFKNRVCHVHLKDRIALYDESVSPAVGTGIVPMKAVIHTLLRNGYNGWFTVEHFGSQHMLKDSETSIRNVLQILDDYKK